MRQDGRVDGVELGAQIIAARSAGELLDAPLDHGFDSGAAYDVQQMITDWRLSRGMTIAGWKLGYTSAAMREQMGIAEPNYGPLLSDMILPSGVTVPSIAESEIDERGRFGVVHPRVEPEIAAVLARDVTDPHDIDNAVGEWRLAIEVVDSVWRDYRFDWALNTADGSSAAYAVVGDAVADLGNLEVEIEVASASGEAEVRRGRADAAMGDPRHALRWLAEQLSSARKVGEPVLRAGDVVITGGLTQAIPLPAGAVATARAGDALVTVTRA